MNELPDQEWQVKCGHCNVSHPHLHEYVAEYDGGLVGIPTEPYCYSCDEALCGNCASSAVPSQARVRMLALPAGQSRV